MVDENEVYLGGFYGPMQPSLGKLAVGAGLYATNRRLFIFRKDMVIAFNKIAGRKGFIPANLTPEQNQAMHRTPSCWSPTPRRYASTPG